MNPASNVSDLFPNAVSLSPRAQWLARHGLTLYRTDKGRWYCGLDDENRGGGRTRDEAIIKFCLKSGIKHWNCEGDVTV